MLTVLQSHHPVKEDLDLPLHPTPEVEEVPDSCRFSSKRIRKLHKSKKSLQVESVRNILVDLLEKSIETENELSKEMSKLQRTNNLPFLEDEKKDTADRKSQYQAEITTCKLEQIRINSLLRQILQIQLRIGNQSSTRSKDVDDDIATIKEFFEIDAIESFGNIPSLRQRLYELESTRRDYEETGAGYLERIPKCWKIRDKYLK